MWETTAGFPSTTAMGHSSRCGLKYAHCFQCCGCVPHVGHILRQDAQLLHDILVEYYESDPYYHHKIPQITKLLHESKFDYYRYDAILDRDGLMRTDEFQYVLLEVLPTLPIPPPKRKTQIYLPPSPPTIYNVYQRQEAEQCVFITSPTTTPTPSSTTSLSPATSLVIVEGNNDSIGGDEDEWELVL